MQTLSAPPLRVGVRASWDTQQRLPYNRNAPRKTPGTTKTLPTLRLTVPTTTSDNSISDVSISELLKRPTVPEEKLERDESYLGYERWLPTPPKVEKPRSKLKASSLAYIGDCIYELYARRQFLFPPLSIEEYNQRVTAVVRCEAQDALLQKLLNENFLSEEERDVLRWGKNVGSAKTRRRAGAAVYNRASSLETLVGYLYLKNVKRLEEVMLKLGFSTDPSLELVFEEATIMLESTRTFIFLDRIERKRNEQGQWELQGSAVFARFGSKIRQNVEFCVQTNIQRGMQHNFVPVGLNAATSSPSTFQQLDMNIPDKGKLNRVAHNYVTLLSDNVGVRERIMDTTLLRVLIEYVAI